MDYAYVFILANFISLAAMLGLITFQEGPYNFMTEQAYHPYYIVDPCSWPFQTCGSLLTTLSRITYFH